MSSHAANVRTLTDDELEQLLERAAARGAERVLASRPPRARRPRVERDEIEVSETDRAAARATARRLGLVVRPGRAGR